MKRAARPSDRRTPENKSSLVLVEFDCGAVLDDALATSGAAVTSNDTMLLVTVLVSTSLGSSVLGSIATVSIICVVDATGTPEASDTWHAMGGASVAAPADAWVRGGWVR